MPLLPTGLQGVPVPFSLARAGSSTTQVFLNAPLILPWSDGSTPASYAPSATFAVLSAYDGSATVDTTLNNWVILGVKGKAQPVLVKEVDIGPTLDPLVGGASWAPLFRIVGTEIQPYPQLGTAPLPQPLVKGAVLYVDPATGAVEWLPPGAKGDLLRGNTWTDGSFYWERYPITAGSQGDVLYNDRSHSGLPIWISAAAAFNGVTPVSPGGALYSNGTAKALSLWNGSANNPAPSNWQAYNFDDSAWGQALTPSGAPTNSIWSEYPGHPTEISLFRQHFTLSGTISAVSLQYFAITTQAIYINGTLLPGSSNNAANTTTSIPLSMLDTTGGDNVLAIAVQTAASSGSLDFFQYVLSVS